MADEVLFPIRCFSCNCILGDKIFVYKELCEYYESENEGEIGKNISELQNENYVKRSKKLNIKNIQSIIDQTKQPTAEYQALKCLKIQKDCCRRMFLSF